jgi:hypothetical protein
MATVNEQEYYLHEPATTEAKQKSRLTSPAVILLKRSYFWELPDPLISLELPPAPLELSDPPAPELFSLRVLPDLLDFPLFVPVPFELTPPVPEPVSPVDFFLLVFFFFFFFCSLVVSLCVLPLLLAPVSLFSCAKTAPKERAKITAVKTEIIFFIFTSLVRNSSDGIY